MPDFIVFNDVSAVAAAPQVDGMVGQVLDTVVSYDIAVAQPKEYPGRILVEDAAVVDVIVQDLVVNRVMGKRLAVPAADQTNAAGPGMADFVVLDKIPGVVIFNIDGIAADGTFNVYVEGNEKPISR